MKMNGQGCSRITVRTAPITATGMNTKSQGNSNMNNQKSFSKMESLPPHAKGSGLRNILFVSISHTSVPETY